MNQTPSRSELGPPRLVVVPDSDDADPVADPAVGPTDPAVGPAVDPAADPDSTGFGDEVADVIKERMRAPMQALQALSDSLRRGELSPELAERMREHTRVLARSVALMLEDLVFVHTSGHRPPLLVIEELVLSERLERTVGLFPELVIAVGPMPGITVNADPLRLEQLLANLVRGTSDGRPMRFEATTDGTRVTLTLLGCAQVDGHELDVARVLAFAQDGVIDVYEAESDRPARVTLGLPDASTNPRRGRRRPRS